MTQENVYSFTVKDWKGQDVSLSSYRGKVLLIVNTATRCGFTPQYEELEALYERHLGQGFEILDFPCNQFGQQAPGTAEEIQSFCKLNYKTAFPQFAKIDVNGEQAAPLFRFLTANTTFQGFPPDGKIAPILEKMLAEKDPDYAKSSDIKWNFTKFLVGRDGRIVRRFEPTASLADVEAAVVEQLGKTGDDAACSGVPTHEMPRILGHRGTAEVFTENGILAFRYALEHGVTGFETDFHLSADNEVIVMHDNNIRRTTTGEGEVETMTVAELKQFKLKNSDETIPTADELFSLFDSLNGFYIELEMKAHYGELYSPERMDIYLDKLYAAANAHLSHGEFMFTSFDSAVLKRMKERHPDAKIGRISGALTPEGLDEAIRLGCYCIAPTYDGTPKSLVDQAKAAGLKVNLWHSETLELWKRIRDMGADVSTNNHPVAVLQAIRENGLV